MVNKSLFLILVQVLILLAVSPTRLYAADTADRDRNRIEKDDEDKDKEKEDKTDEDLSGKIVIVVRKPVDFRLYSKAAGVFVVEAKYKGEIDGYDIRVRKADSDTAKNYRAVTTHNLRRRFIGAKPNDVYKVKVRTFRTVGGKDYPSKWTKELQVIVWPRNEDEKDSSTRLTEFPAKKVRKNKKKK